MPPELGQLDALQVLDVADNRLTGHIPQELGNLTKLTYLNLAVNQLDGPIPSEIGNLTRLTFLDLAQNQLTDSIPWELGNLTGLEDLVLGANRLSGEIPKEIAQLTELKVLVLDSNEFVGEIPRELAGLKKLRILRLDGNFLAGCVPDELKVTDFNVGGLYFCSELEPVSDPQLITDDVPVFEGGVDLGVVFIERLPRYLTHRVAYSVDSHDCPYPFEEFVGVVDCERDVEIKRWPDPGDTVELIAHVRNYGDTPSGPFAWQWKIDDEVLIAKDHDGLDGGKRTRFKMTMTWPDSDENPVVEFVVDPLDQVEELIEDNNLVTDWIKGYTIGIYYSQIAYDSLKLSNQTGRTIQSPDQWVHNNAVSLNGFLARAGLEDRIRLELFFITDERHPRTALRRYLDGWWPVWDGNYFTLEDYTRRPDIDIGLHHEWLHQLGVIDLYWLHVGPRNIQLPDVNRPGKQAACGPPYHNTEWECFRLPYESLGLMSDASVRQIGAHTAGALRANSGFRRGYYGEYLYDTPTETSIKVVDSEGNPVPDATVHFYQLGLGGLVVTTIDDIPEFTVVTDAEGSAKLPNRGPTGITTATGHQHRPNPFGLINVVGQNGLFLIEMISDECTNYEWLNITELNLAYWDGHTETAEFTKTLRCPPP